MKDDIEEENPQFERLTTHLVAQIIAFRWLWVVNLIAAIVGAVLGRFELMALAGFSTLVSLVGAAFARKGLRTAVRAIVSTRRKEQESEESGVRYRMSA